ncbi:MAG: hypothetical protein ACI8RZ_001725 [Myxococcota bacterium]|jgi:hypothetical protein
MLCPSAKRVLQAQDVGAKWLPIKGVEESGFSMFTQEKADRQEQLDDLRTNFVHLLRIMFIKCGASGFCRFFDLDISIDIHGNVSSYLLI